MSERNTVLRSLHDVGLAAWFGGSLMGGGRVERCGSGGGRDGGVHHPDRGVRLVEVGAG